ncbi:MAG: hypothetical protein HY000_29545 [Planctomycetes bacterium]|nr:hypothetical protein [Planctomycetota bacterium]
MLTARDIVFGVGLPAIIAGVVLVIAWRPWRSQPTQTGGEWGGPLALGVGFAVAYLTLLGRPPFPPIDSTDWLFFLALLLTVCGVVDSLWSISGWRRWVLGLANPTLSVSLLLWPLARNTWSQIEGVAWIAALAATVWLWWIALDTHAGRDAAVSPLLQLVAVSGVASLVLMLSASLKLAQLGGALTGAVGASFVLALVGKSRVSARGTIQVFVVLFLGLVISGHFFASLTALNAVLLGAAPLLTWIDQIPTVQKLRAWQRGAVGTTAVILPCVAALAFATVNFVRSMPDYGEY